MAEKEDKSLFSGTLKRYFQNHRTAAFKVIDANGVGVGKLVVNHRHVIDHSKAIGKHGVITNPGLDYFPESWELKIEG